MTQDFSPEEKLLRLIRGEKKQKNKSISEEKGLPQYSAEKSPTENRNVKYERRIHLVFNGEDRYLKFVNSALIVMFAVAIAFFIFDLLHSKSQQVVSVSGRESKIVGQSSQPSISEKEGLIQEQVIPFSMYSEVIGKRELFKPIRSEVQEKAVSEKKSESRQDKLKDLSLIGIVAGEEPQAIVEDKKNQKTYFLYKGQEINQMKVEDILEDRIILNFDGEKIELTL